MAGIRLLAITSLICGAVVSIAPASRAGVDAAPTPLPDTPSFESEPNGNAGTATVLGDTARIRGDIVLGSDVDFYSFSASAGQRVFAATMTSGSRGGVDTVLSLIGTDGTTVLESDDDDGSFAGDSSSIAGFVIPSSGVYYLRVVSGNADQIRPYDLFFQVAGGSPTAEVEPNDFTDQEVPVSGWIAGSMSSLTDVDGYSVPLEPGDTLFVSLDLDPERDATTFNGSLAIGVFGSSFNSVNDGGVGDAIDSEANFVTVKSSGGGGLYSILVGSTGDFTTYHLSVTVIPAEIRSCYKFDSNEVSKPIVDAGTTMSTINVGPYFRIGRAAIDIDLTHASMSDLDISLQTAPANEIALISDDGTGGFQTLNTRLDDAAALPAGALPNMNGQVLQTEPAARLAWTDGEVSGGDWTLVIRDDQAGNTGTFNSWSLILCEAEPDPAGLDEVYANDFEFGDAGFTHSGTGDEWDRGLPSFEPITTCNSGANCWKTDLDNTYDASASYDLVSPPIDLTPYDDQVIVSWSQRYQLENAKFDHFRVIVQEAGGANPRRLFDWTGATMSETLGAAPGTLVKESAGWGRMVADISEYAGSNIELVFHLDSDISGELAGVAIDDVSVAAAPTDATPPTVPDMNALGDFRTKKKIPLSWTESTDAESGVTQYDLKMRSAAPNKPLGPAQDVGSSTGTSTTFTGVPGDTYCFSVQALNGEGINSPSGSEQCTSLPLDDRKLKKSPEDWAEKTGKGHYLKTFLRSDDKGAALKKTVKATTLALVVTKCPDCGKVAVFLDGDKEKTISLNAASTQKRKIIPLKTFPAREKVKVKIEIVSNHKLVNIDGLGASAI